ncbi:MAG: YihY/virulence factor BrkB family protein, partial [Marmoricola sp.]
MKNPRGNIVVTSAKSFVRHDDTDLAAGLTYYAVLAIFPAALALLSLLAVVGNPDDTIRTINDILQPLISSDRLHDVQPSLHRLTRTNGASLTLVAGIAGAVYSSSAYVGAFSRAMNQVREVEETRPFWKLRPLMLLITLAAVVLNALALVIITVSGPIAESVGSELGVKKSAVDIWDIAKWPVLVILVAVMLAILYYAAPNVRQPGFHWVTPGGLIAVLLWIVVSALFALYVSNFSSYNKTYGSVAGAIVALLWLWLTNVALLFGAEVDAVRDARIAEDKAARAAAA